MTEASSEPDRSAPALSPSEIVTTFLHAMADGDMETAVDLVDENLVYENVGLPTIRGKRRFSKGAEQFSARGLGFDVRIHRIAENGTSVLTERTDAILVGGRYRSQFWVCGVFEVHDGRITLWRDYFDFKDVTAGSLRGLLGIAVPSLQATFANP
jgi:limonene-1,2-epoxide hydrolase